MEVDFLVLVNVGWVCRMGVVSLGLETTVG